MKYPTMHIPGRVEACTFEMLETDVPLLRYARPGTAMVAPDLEPLGLVASRTNPHSMFFLGRDIANEVDLLVGPFCTNPEHAHALDLSSEDASEDERAQASTQLQALVFANVFAPFN